MHDPNAWKWHGRVSAAIPTIDQLKACRSSVAIVRADVEKISNISEDWFIESAVRAAPPLTAKQKYELGKIIRPAYAALLRERAAIKAAADVAEIELQS